MNAQAADRRVDAAVLVGSEVLLALLTLSAVASFARVFADNSWATSLVAAAIVAHITIALMRRLNRGLLLTGLASIVVMALQVTWTHYRDTATTGLPTGATRDAVDLDVTAAWNLFSEVKAPADAAVGFLVMATIAIWVIAYLSDWAAFRLWSSIETVLPSFAMFVFIAFFGTDTHQYRYAALYLAAILIFQLFHRLLRQSQEVRWLAGTQRSGTRSLLGVGSVVAVLGVLGAVIAGPALPGADQEAIIDLDQRANGPDTRVVLSPIVDIRGRLVDQADVEAFTVRSPIRSYWRLASLDKFDGQIWGADNKYSQASGGLPDDFPVQPADVQTVVQEFDIAALGAVWIPAAFEPREILSSSDESISYEPVSGTLIVGRKLETSNGLSYTVESVLPRFDPVALANAPGDQYPTEILDRYLDLPANFSPTATALAFEITRDATNDYERALALQNYFRAFNYNVNVGAGHSSNRIDEFLQSGEGYCEQFAGSFAAMARALNIPSRVAVGFTWGEQDANDPELYHVRGEHAHAWPEVYIQGNGWVPFEPTPTRGAPGAQQWTDVPAEQAGSAPGSEAEPTPVPTPNVGQIPEDAGSVPEEAPDAGQLDPVAAGGGVPGWAAKLGLVVVGLVGLSVLYSAAVIAGKHNRSTRRFRTAVDNRGKVQALWTDAADALRPLGIERRPHETVAEFSERAGEHHSSTKLGLTELGRLTVAASYGPEEPPDPAVEQAEHLRDEVQAAVVQLTTPTERWRERLDPRPLLRR